MSRRINGSPPVNRIFVIPRFVNIFVILPISVAVSKLVDGVNGTPSSGIQYIHRKLHFSVSDSLKYVCARPNVSFNAVLCVRDIARAVVAVAFAAMDDVITMVEVVVVVVVAMVVSDGELRLRELATNDVSFRE